MVQGCICSHAPPFSLPPLFLENWLVRAKKKKKPDKNSNKKKNTIPPVFLILDLLYTTTNGCYHDKYIQIDWLQQTGHSKRGTITTGVC